MIESCFLLFSASSGTWIDFSDNQGKIFVIIFGVLLNFETYWEVNTDVAHFRSLKLLGELTN